MSWITSILSLLSNCKSKIIIGLACICLVFGIGYKLYQYGYDNGVVSVQLQVEQEKELWTKKVSQIQNQFDKQSLVISEQHKQQVDKLNQQIVKLQKNPKIIEKYIPVQMNQLVPETLVLLHDRAVKGISLDQMIPDQLINKTSSCTLSDFTSTMTYNYTVCNQCYDRLNKLQSIVSKYIEAQKDLVK